MSLPDRKLQSFGRVREVSEDTRQVTVVISTSGVATDDAIIDQRGWDFSRHEANPAVLWSHKDGELPIARAVRTIRGDNETIQVHEFATHPVAEQIFQLVRDGYINSTSVRWIPGETERRVIGEGGERRTILVFTRGHQLLEVSYVNIPADAGALVMRADGGALSIADYEEPEPATAEEAVKEEPDPTERFLKGFVGGGETGE